MNKVKWFQILSITINLNKHNSFVYTQLNDQTVLFQSIPFSIKHLFALDLNIKQLYYRTLSGATIPGQRGSRSNRGTPHFCKLHRYWSFTIRLFSVISKTLVSRGVLPSVEIQSVYSTVPADCANKCRSCENG